MNITCYKSCETCSKDISESNEEQHNCIICKENYYKSPENNNNCYSLEEKNTNWYLDLSISKFAFCDYKCISFLGQNVSK